VPAARATRPRHGAREQHEHDERAGHRVDHADEQRAARLAEQRQQQEREREPAHERADVVRGEQVRGGRAGVLAADPLQQRHQQRDLRADERADQQRDRDQRRPVEVEPGERGVQAEHGQPADERERRLDRGEAREWAALQRFRGQ
jgi:hypothetical protein